MLVFILFYNKRKEGRLERKLGPEVSSMSIVLCHYHSSTVSLYGVSSLMLGRGLAMRKRRRLMLLALVEVKRFLDLVAEALAVRGPAVATVLLLVDIASSTTLQ
jgi:hypothetical protein